MDYPQPLEVMVHTRNILHLAGHGPSTVDRPDCGIGPGSMAGFRIPHGLIVPSVTNWPVPSRISHESLLDERAETH
jgi:hypothetical protein